jgi:urease accessory protein
MASAALLLLTDGRLPSGGHAHSGGVEEAVTDGRVHDVASLERFLLGRLWTVGHSEAAVAAAAAGEATLAAAAAGEATAPVPRWRELDAEAAARCPSPAARRASRAMGRGLLRAASAAWPGPWAAALRATAPDGPMSPVVIGAAAHAAGAGVADAALAAAHGAVTGPAAAAVRLLALDPLSVAGVLARLAADVDEVAAGATRAARAAGEEGWRTLPAGSAPLIDTGAERHATREVRLFAS